MTENSSASSPGFSLWKLILPVSIGIGVSLYLLISSFNPAALSSVHLSKKLFLGLFLGIVTVLVRDFSFMYKLRLSTGNRLPWLKTLQTVLMWEFGAAVTPKLSEAAFVLYVLKKSGLSYGRSVGVLMLNALLDNSAFVIIFSILYYLIGLQMLVLPANCPDLAGHQIMTGIRHFADKAWIGYVFILALCLFLAVSLFILPHSTKKFFYQISSFVLLRRFKNNLLHLGDEIEITAAEFKDKTFGFWIKMTIATFINWIARYLLTCALIFAFSHVAINFLHVFARQYVLWIFLAVPSTPGASGVAELSFIALNCEYMPAGLGVAIALIWRMYSYYLYLILGMIVLPKWVKGVMSE